MACLELEILDLVSQGKRTLPELEAATGKNKSTVYRACAAMEGDGWLEAPRAGDGYLLSERTQLLWLRSVEALKREALALSDRAARLGMIPVPTAEDLGMPPETADEKPY